MKKKKNETLKTERKKNADNKSFLKQINIK